MEKTKMNFILSCKLIFFMNETLNNKLKESLDNYKLNNRFVISIYLYLPIKDY